MAKTNYIPVDVSVLNGKKSVKFPVKWQDYQFKQYTGLFTANNGRAVICGQTSDDLCGLDFDNHDGQGCVFEQFQNAMKPSIMEKLAVEKTPCNGYHVYFRFPGITQKKILAKRVSGVATIELQASEKALLFCSPSQGYTQINGTIEDAPLLTWEEFNSLIDCAMYLNEYIEQPKKPAKVETEFASDSNGDSPAEFLRGNVGREWAMELLERNGFTPNGTKKSSNGFDFVTYSHPNASDWHDVHLGLYNDHVFLWSTNELKNMGLSEGAVSFYDLIRTIGFNGNATEMAREYYKRFPEKSNGGTRNVAEDFGQTEQQQQQQETEKQTIVGGYTKGAVLYKIKSAPEYELLKSHIETSAKHAPKPLEYSYLLTGLSLVGLASYSNFYSLIDGDDEKDILETGFSFCICAPPASGKESVKCSLTVYDEFFDTSDVPTNPEEGLEGEISETGINEFPDKSDRYIEKTCCRGRKNALYIKDEFQDVLGIRNNADSMAQRSFAIAKKLMTNKERIYKCGGSSNFDQICAVIQKNLGRPIDFSNWRLSLACFGTNNVFSSLASGDEENGFCRRIIWNREEMQLVVAPNPNERSTRPRPSKRFGKFLRGLIHMRDNTGRIQNGVCVRGKGTEPVCPLKWENDAVELYQETSRKINDEYLNGKYQHNVILSYAQIVPSLAMCFAISRGKWLNYNPYDLPDDLGGEAFADSKIAFSSVSVNYDDVDLAIAVFLISCNEYEIGVSEFVKVSQSEEGTRKLENSVLKLLKQAPSGLESLARRVKYSVTTVQRVLDSLKRSGTVIENKKPSGKIVFSYNKEA